MKRIAVGVAILVASASAAAQQAPASPRPDPLDARAAVPPVVHASPFARYRPFAVDGPAPWRALNDEVARIGGWKAYAREAYEAAKAEAAAQEGAAKPADAAQGHGMHKDR